MPHSLGHGMHLSFNGRVCVERHGATLEADVVQNIAQDGTLLKERVEGVEKNTGKDVKKVAADAGYHETLALKDLAEGGMQRIILMGAEVGKARNG